ncbi:MAG: guanylate cyclase [Leptospiraceae bacterium]|nr:guanylate cyclase [Leptospiraceae bacterium]
MKNLPIINKLYLFLFMLLLSVNFLAAQDTVLELKDNQSGFYIGKNLFYYEDKTGKIEIEDIINPEFQNNFIKSEVEALGFGFKTSVYWLKFTVKNTSDKPLSWILELAYPMIDQIKLYSPKTEGGFDIRMEGDEKPFRERKILYRNFLFEMNEAPNIEAKDYYLRIQSTSSMNFPLIVWFPQNLTEKINQEQTLLGMSYGIIFIMIFYNLFILISTRDLSYLYYILFVLFYGSFLITLNGVAFEYLWPNWVWWANNCLPFFICTASLFGLLFGKSFLNTTHFALRFTKWMNILMGIAGIGMIVSLFFKYSVGIKIAAGLAGITVISLLIAGIICLIKGYRPARFYLIAWFALILGITAYVLKTFGIIPTNFFTHWGVQIGAVMEMFLLSLGLADKINALKAEKEKAQRELNIAYGRFVPHEFLNFLDKKSILDVNLGDQILKQMSVLFCDIRSFTSLSEQMTPEENFNFINAYLGRVVPVFRKNHGIVDKFIGDGIMALFPHKPDDAVKAALEFLEILKEYNIQRQSFNLIPIKVGIGIHTGQLMLGTIGHEEFMQGSVISDSVNLASRIESLTKKVGASLLISKDVLDGLENPNQYSMRYIGNIKVKGKSKYTAVYEIFDGEDSESKDLKMKTREEFAKGVEYFYDKEYNLARQSFESVFAVFPHDRATNTYLARLKEKAYN